MERLRDYSGTHGIGPQKGCSTSLGLFGEDMSGATCIPWSLFHIHVSESFLSFNGSKTWKHTFKIF